MKDILVCMFKEGLMKLFFKIGALLLLMMCTAVAVSATSTALDFRAVYLLGEGSIQIGVTPSGEVFFYNHENLNNDGRKEVRFVPEYGGKILWIDGRFYYEKIMTNEHGKEYSTLIQIGAEKLNFMESINGEKIAGVEICSGKFHSVCELAFSKKVPARVRKPSLRTTNWHKSTLATHYNYENKRHQEDIEAANEEGPAFYSVGIIFKQQLNKYGKRTFGSSTTGRYFDLSPYIFSSPNQEDAGSCLYMATTGAAEILFNQTLPENMRQYEGESDLSERFIMNVETDASCVNDWRTDTIYAFNCEGGGLLNRDYRYTKGWYKWVARNNAHSASDATSVATPVATTSVANTFVPTIPSSTPVPNFSAEEDKELVKSHKGDPEAEYGTEYNWINEYKNNTELHKKLIRSPKFPQFERALIFVDPQHDQWNTGIMDNLTIEKIKSELRTRNAPVLVIYNHFGYWHAVLIVGYDDDKNSEGCAIVLRWKKEISKQALELINSGNKEKIKKGKKYQRYVQQVDDAITRDGGICPNQGKGIFYVRDSIYDGENEPTYIYDMINVDQEGSRTPYSKKIIEHSYEWLKYLGNHAYVIYRK